MSTSIRSGRYLIGLIILIAIIAAGVIIWSTKKSSEKPSMAIQDISIAAISPSFTGYTIYVALEKGYFRKQGLKVDLKSFSSGKATLDALIKGKVDLATSSETPFMRAVLNGGKIYVLGTMITGEKHLAVVGRKDKGISSPKDLKGKTIAVTMGSNGEYFLDTVLLLNGVSKDQVKTVHVKPKQMFDALIKGEVDAIATWNPQMTKARRALGDQATTIYAEGLYSPSFLIAARQDYANANPEIIKKVLRSLVTASKFIHESPDQSRMIVAKYLGMDKSLLDELSATYHFKITLDQSLLLTLENQTKWAIQNKLTGQTKVPNYLDFIYLDGLTAIKPEGVTIIR
ncbi:MAG: ABC transporter substrate-binding protein [Deltaproteobacteria bacterium]|nr:ABC transporter substrate-binding protein [Deltaproteobacteria bacterium]